MATPLQQLAEAAGTDFPHLFGARELTSAKLAERRPRLQQLEHDEDVAIVLMGSWGRSEVTSGSDDDYMVLVTGEMRDEVRPAKAEIETILGRAPGKQCMPRSPRDSLRHSAGEALRGSSSAA